jgi:hypothetical protein
MKFKLFQKKTCIMPTLTGWSAILLFLVCGAWLMVNNLYSFLAKNEPIDASIMVVEGWMQASAIHHAAQLFKQKNYTLAFSTGIPFENKFKYIACGDYAALGAVTLTSFGVDSARVVPVCSPGVKADRTFASGVALKHWVDSTGLTLAAVNLVSQGPHSRRSQLLFQKALGKKTRVGIISSRDESYDPAKWWKTSNGFRAVIDEAVAYVYAIVFLKAQ